MFLAPDGRCRVSPDLIRVINVPFEAQEIAQSCGRGAQITGWGDPHSVCAPDKSMSQRVRERQRAERQKETGRPSERLCTWKVTNKEAGRGSEMEKTEMQRP